MSDIDHPESAAQPARWPLPLLIIAAIIPRLLLYIDRLNRYHLSGNLNILGGSDVPGWLGMATHLSSNWTMDYWLLGARPPLFPLVVALVYRAGGGLEAALALQSLFGVITALAAALLAFDAFSQVQIGGRQRLLALCVGLIVALDPASISAEVTLMSEPLFNMTFALTFAMLGRYIRFRRAHWLALTALAMAGAMLTRPTGIYLWLVFPFILLPLLPSGWKPALVLACAGLLIYGGWSWRNLHYLDRFTYSTQGDFQLLFYRAVSAERLATGRDADAIRDDYVREIFLRTGREAEAAQVETGVTWWAFIVPERPDLQEAMGDLARERLATYWLYALAGTPVGLWRMYAITNSIPPLWQPLELLYHLILYSCALWGLWSAWRSADRGILLMGGLPLLYITGLTMVSQVSGMDTRMRTVITAFIALLAVYGGYQLSVRWQKWRAARSVESTAPAAAE